MIGLGLHLPGRGDTLMTADMMRNIQDGNITMTEVQMEGTEPFLNHNKILFIKNKM